MTVLQNDLPLNILIVGPSGLGKEYSGVTRQIMGNLRKVSEIQSQKIRFHLIYDSSLHYTTPPFFETEVNVHVRGKRWIISYFLNSKVVSAARLGYVIHRNYPEVQLVFISSLNFRNLVLAFILRALGRKSLARIASHKQELGSYNRRAVMRLWYALRSRLISCVDDFLAISTEIGADLEKIGVNRERIHLIPNSCDTDRFRPASISKRDVLRVQLGFPAAIVAKVIILMVGGVNARKGFLEAIYSLSKLATRYCLVIVGPIKDPRYFERMTVAIKELCLEERVHWFDYSENIEDFFSAADIFLLISDDEGMPNALVEAQACGLLCIATDVSGVKDIFQGSFGVIVERDAQVIAKSLVASWNEWVSDPHKREVVRTSVVAKYSASVVAERTAKLFFDVVARESK